jgi:hypothetical protein
MKTREELEKLFETAFNKDSKNHDVSNEEKASFRRGFIIGYQLAEKEELEDVKINATDFSRFVRIFSNESEKRTVFHYLKRYIKNELNIKGIRIDGR